MNGLERYYYVNNVYAGPELSPTYTLAADSEIEKFVVTDPVGIGRQAYTSPVLSNENYVFTRAPQIPVTDVNSIGYTDEVIEQISYFDGLGRGIQTIGIRAGGAGEDIITPIKYDEFGRMAREHLPYARMSLEGEKHPETIEAERIYGTSQPHLNFYHTLKYEFTENPYSETEFEASPLNRVMKQAAPGNDWKLGSGREIEFAYQSNAATEVRLFQVEFLNGDFKNPALTIAAQDHYGAGELYKTITRDENHTGSTKNNTTEEFKDKQGRVVLKRTYSDLGTQTQVPHDTYYIYDDYGNLTYVLPPKMDGSTATLTNVLGSLAALGYQYKYDHRNRLIEKKIPGKGWEYIVYNSLDQPILTQDVLLRAENKWLYTKYDAFGRVINTGIFTDTQGTAHTQAAMQSVVDDFYGGSPSPMQYEEKPGSTYTNRSFPTGGTELLTENFYDDYNFDKSVFVVPDFNNYGREIYIDRTRGLPTGSRVKVLETSNWITTVIGYDKKGRAIWTASKNEFLGTDDIFHSDLDFVGKLRAQTNVHTKAGQTINTEDLYSYDHMRRQLTHSQTINGGSSELIARNKYDELGALTKKSVGGSISNQSNAPELVATEFMELVHLEVRENREIHKISGGTTETGIAKTTKTFTGDGYVEFSPMTSDKMYSVGLTYVDPNNPDIQYNYFAYVQRNFIKISEGGANLEYSMDYQVNVEPGDKLTVEREGSSVLYKKNGETFYISNKPSYGEIRGEAWVRDTGPIMHYMKLVDLEENLNPLQNVHYTYNVHGWLKKINEPTNLGNDLFGFEINYNKPTAGATALFNGNISETHWNTKSENLTANPVSNRYVYSYDALNRITGAIDNTGHYNLGNVTYDKMGNILSLQRQGQIDADITGFGDMDALSYDYNGNRLMQVDDASNNTEGFKDGNSGVDYGYDDNGNLTFDANKGINNITYNHLNLPVDVEFNGSSSQTIHYTYDAAGGKLRKEIPGKTTDYAGNFVYEDQSGSMELQFFSTLEGYVSYYNGQFNYVYNYKDHLGNVRLSYSDINGDGHIKPEDNEILDENNYYPFGLEHQGYNTKVVQENNFMTYNGKEFEESLGLNVIEMDWRQYDPAIGRFLAIDPVTHYYQSTYTAFDDNPIFFADPSGTTSTAEWMKENEITQDDFITVYKADGSESTNLPDDTYKLGKNGKITKIDSKKHYENGNEVDKLISEKTGKTTNVKDGELDKLKHYDEETKYQLLELSTSSNMTPLMNFYRWLIGNSNVEFSITRMSNELKAYITTGYDKGSEPGVTELLLNLNISDLSRYSTIYTTHNHPNNNVSSSDGDMEFAKSFTPYFSNRIRFFVTGSNTTTTIEYDQNGDVKR